MPNPVSVPTIRLNNASSTTTVSNYFVQADTNMKGAGTDNVVIPDRDKVFLPVVGGTGITSTM